MSYTKSDQQEETMFQIAFLEKKRQPVGKVSMTQTLIYLVIFSKLGTNERPSDGYVSFNYQKLILLW